jgi:hypothetical protein
MLQPKNFVNTETAATQPWLFVVALAQSPWLGMRQVSLSDTPLPERDKWRKRHCVQTRMRQQQGEVSVNILSHSKYSTHSGGNAKRATTV